MRKINEYGYDYTLPNPPFLFRDQLQKCDCGNTYVGVAGRKCPACVAESITNSVIEMRRILNETLKD